jgi:menaquinone-dependent protoporphyrinogen oxidase
MMRVLVAFGSKRGGTAGLADLIAEAFTSRGVATDVQPAAAVGSLDGYDAVVVAGALYANRWHRDAVRFVRRNANALRERKVWFASSGPLDDTAREGDIPPVHQVQKLMHTVGVRGHITFGGRLAADADGFIAKRMAKKLAGDWRDPEHVRNWVDTIVTELESTSAA